MRLILSTIIITLVFFSCQNKNSETELNKENTIQQQVSRIIKTDSVAKVKELKFEYHIIASSFNTKEKADLFSSQLYKKAYPSSVIFSEKKYRVSLRSFANKQTAINELAHLKFINKHKNLWILKQ